PSAIQNGAKATFGFELRCNSKTNVFSGQLEYKDHGVNSTYPSGLALHGTVPKASVSSLGITGVTTCADLDALDRKSTRLNSSHYLHDALPISIGDPEWSKGHVWLRAQMQLEN